jgi:hypothetical protein
VSALGKGALAGAIAAGVWAAQQPLDKRALRSRYDDVELLGKAVTAGSGWLPAGLAMHLGNGAAFGAAYSRVRPRIPLPGWAAGALVAQAENFGSWPLVRLTDRFHPARDELPRLKGNRRGLVLATWRHLVFGATLGVVYDRMAEGGR